MKVETTFLGAVKLLNSECFMTAAKSALSELTDNSKSSRRLKIDIACKEKQMPSQTLSDDYSQQLMTYNETGIDISLVMAYHHKFHHQNKKNNCISSAGMFVFVGINH